MVGGAVGNEQLVQGGEQLVLVGEDSRIGVQAAEVGRGERHHGGLSENEEAIHKKREIKMVRERDREDEMREREEGRGRGKEIEMSN